MEARGGRGVANLLGEVDAVVRVVGVEADLVRVRDVAVALRRTAHQTQVVRLEVVDGERRHEAVTVLIFDPQIALQIGAVLEDLLLAGEGRRADHSGRLGGVVRLAAVEAEDEKSGEGDAEEPNDDFGNGAHESPGGKLMVSARSRHDYPCE